MDKNLGSEVKKFLKEIDNAGIPSHILDNPDDLYIHYQVLVFVQRFSSLAGVPEYIDFIESICEKSVSLELRQAIGAFVNNKNNANKTEETDFSKLGKDDEDDEGEGAEGCAEKQEISLRDFCMGIVEAQLEYGPSQKTNETEQRFEKLAEICRLSPADKEILIILYMIRRHSTFGKLYNTAYHSRNKIELFHSIAEITGRTRSEIYRSLGAGQPLIELGLLDLNREIKLDERPLAYLEGLSDGPYCDTYFEPHDMSDSGLNIEDFDTALQDHFNHILQLIKQPSCNRGFTALFYGPAGTGKTAAANVIARDLRSQGWKVYSVRTSPSPGKGASIKKDNFRLHALQASVLMDPEETVIICDEADPLLCDGIPRNSLFTKTEIFSANKDKLNSFLDRNRLSVIFISNAYQCMNESTKRRFDYSVNFPSLTPAQMHHIWERTLEREGLSKLFSKEEIETITREYNVEPGGMVLVTRSIKKLLEAGISPMEATRRILQQHCRLMKGAEKQYTAIPCTSYSPDVINIISHPELPEVMHMLKRFSQDGIQADESAQIHSYQLNLILWGPPGTGKTEFVKYAAQELGLELIIRTPGDILSMYVGGTEKNIQSAFAEASEKRSILFFDEIDGILSNRQNAIREHEASKVNELLLRMENFQGIFMASTNLKGRLDPACQRRFHLKMEFDFLQESGKIAMFERILQPLTGEPVTPENKYRLQSIRQLAPGDFKIVAHQACLLGDTSKSNENLIEKLEQEAAERPETSAQKIGFSIAS